MMTAQREHDLLREVGLVVSVRLYATLVSKSLASHDLLFRPSVWTRYQHHGDAIAAVDHLCP